MAFGVNLRTHRRRAASSFRCPASQTCRRGSSAGRRACRSFCAAYGRVGGAAHNRAGGNNQAAVRKRPRSPEGKTDWRAKAARGSPRRPPPQECSAAYYAAPRLSAVMPERSSSLQDVLQVRAVRALAGRRAAQSRRGCSKETPDRPVAGRNSTAAARVGWLGPPWTARRGLRNERPSHVTAVAAGGSAL